MSLTEIETAVQQLSVAEQHELLRHLEESLRPRHRNLDRPARERWMQELAALRNAICTNAPALTIEQILAESRAD
jgi:hypothetical protein